ncbi:MAG: ribosome hibernation-promoting factor, HPF/YfiA family, partial [Streptosporangiaceae bacterium]
MDIIFKARHTDVRQPFRKHASAKLARIEKLDGKATRIDVQITAEPNVRDADRRERVELTVTSRGPAIRAEAAADDRFVAFDQAFAKLESRLRRACDRRKGRHGAHAAIRLTDLPEADVASDAELPAIRLG